MSGSAPPLLTARDQLELDHSLGAQVDPDVAVGILRGEGHVDAGGLGQGRRDLGLSHDLREVDRADLLLALADQHQVDRRLTSGSAQRVQRRQERRLGPFLVHRAPADHHLAEARLVHQPRLPRRGGPLLRIDLLHVVHEVQAHALRRSRVERGENAGEPIGGHPLGALEARVAQHAQEELHALLPADALGGDGGLADPLLQALDGFAVALLDLALDRSQIGGARQAGEHQRSGPHQRAAQE